MILHDNAPYATSDSVLELMEGLRIPMLFTGPHSYDAAPIELFFAAFKADDVNPNQLPQGIRYVHQLFQFQFLILFLLLVISIM